MNGKTFTINAKKPAYYIYCHYLSAQTAFYSLSPDRDILGPLAINPAYIRLAQASGQSYHSSGLLR
jgi:hypothetical protein